VSTRPQRVRIATIGLDVEFAAGEAIHTENSYKYSPEEIAALVAASSMQQESQWLDTAGRFSVNLGTPQADQALWGGRVCELRSGCMELFWRLDRSWLCFGYTL